MMERLAEFVQENSTLMPDKKLKDDKNKGLVRSAFQKAMRRGQLSNALKYGAYLLNHNSSYAFYSLAIIAIEDIGFGSPSLITYSSKALSKKVREAVGEEELFSALIVEGCRSFKSRGCCELSLGCDLMYKVEEEEMAEYNQTQLLKMAMNPEDVTGCYLATKLLRGTKKDGGHSIPEMEELYDYIRTQMSGDWSEAVVNTIAYRVDSMSCAAWPMFWKAWQVREGLEVIEDELPLSVKVKGVPGEAYDMHVGTGAIAIKAFYTHLAKKYDAINCIPKNKAGKVLGAAVFIEEGGLVDNRIYTEWLDTMKDFQDKSFLLGYGLEGLGDPDEIRKIVRDNLDVLNQKRAWAATL